MEPPWQRRNRIMLLGSCSRIRKTIRCGRRVLSGIRQSKARRRKPEMRILLIFAQTQRKSRGWKIKYSMISADILLASCEIFAEFLNMLFKALIFIARSWHVRSIRNERSHQHHRDRTSQTVWLTPNQIRDLLRVHGDCPWWFDLTRQMSISIWY